MRSTDSGMIDRSTVRAGPQGYQFSIYFDGSYVHYAYRNTASKAALYYCRGDPDSSGSISWSTEQTAVSGVNKYWCSYPTICVDSNRCPWIDYYHYYNSGGDGYAYVTASTDANGGWTARTSFSDFGNGLWQTLNDIANWIRGYLSSW